MTVVGFRAQDQLRGSLGTIREQVRAAKKELQLPNYRDIDERYRKQLICLKTTEMAHSDVEKYHKVRFSIPVMINFH
jgi:DNA repair protein RAD50